MIKATPLAYQQAMDSGKIEVLRQQLIGEFRGLTHLSNILAQRESELKQKLAQDDKQ